jgi:MFS family permease
MRDRAFKMGVANGTLFEVVMSIIQPGTVLSAFFLRLTGSTFFSTLPFAVMQIGWLWPQLIVSNVAEARPRKMPIYVASGLTRVAAVIGFAVATCWSGGEPSPYLAYVCLVLFFAYCSATGAGGIAFMDIVGKTIPATRRGSFMGWRGFYGGILGIAAGMFVRYMLSDDGPGFPLDYVMLYAVAAVFLLAAVLAFALIPEPVASAPKQRVPFREHLSRGKDLFRHNRNYRLLFGVQIMGSLSMLGQIVFIPYALTELGLPDSIVGVLIMVATLCALPSNFLWSHIGDRYGNRLLQLISMALYLTVPALALASYYLPPWRLDVPVLRDYDLRAATFVLACIVATIAGKGRGVGSMNYLLEISPEASRPSYVAFMSVLLAPAALVPLMAGSLAELLSFQATFALSLVFGLVVLLQIYRLGEPRQQQADGDADAAH